jgi:hypothetical protein
MNNSYTINKCQISGSNKLIKILNLGFLPPVNEYKDSQSIKIDKEEIFFPAELLYCPVSKLFQIGCVVNRKILFPKTYPYTSSTTKQLRDNFNDLFKKTKKIVNLSKNDLVIDIGSNDGNLLSNFLGTCKVLGITPENIGKIAIKRGVPTLLRYFDKSSVKIILQKYQKAKIITATNVFAHIDKPIELLKLIIQCLDEKDGIFISESHYLLSLIQTLQYDTIYHEHLRYYSLSSIKYFFDKFNLKIFHVEKIKTHGGSIRIYASKSSRYKVNKSVLKTLGTEKNELSKNKIENFVKNVKKSKLELLKIIIDLKLKNKKIFGVGSPSRASTLINYVGIDDSMLDCILEIKGSYKIGKDMPGTTIPVVNEEVIKKNKPDYLLILSWHISRELIKNFKKKGFKGKFIIPLPKPKIL